jgi:UDP-N-acetylmuramyl tripeptide synthase
MSERALEQMGVPGICDAIDRFVSCNRGSRDDRTRWLADYLSESLRVCQQVRSGNLAEENMRAVADFRLTEIENAKKAKQREIDDLDREAKKLLAASR